MSLPRYLIYKDSGVSWLGEVPAHWDVYPLKRELDFLTSGSRGWAEHYSDDGALFLRIGNLTRDSIRLDLSDIQRVDIPDGAEGARTRVKPGDVLFSITAYLGSVAVVPEGIEAAFVSQHVALARLKEKGSVLPAWSAYVALSWIGKTYLETTGYGGTKVQLSLDDVANLLLTVPPLTEQSVITAFLDQETAKIDALIAEQEKLIALLAEKRQATISRAVTRGLDPNVPLKDSGVPWLGKVPVHWIVKRFRDVCLSISTGPFGTALGTSDYISGGVPVINPSHIVDGKIVPDDDVTVSVSTADRLDYWVIRTGEIVVARRGELGRAAVVEACSDGWICGTGSLRVTPNHDCVTAYFLHAILQSKYAREWLNQQSVGSTMANLNEGILGNLPIVVPVNLEEQSQLIDELFVKLQKIDRMIFLAEQNIALSQERRAALISAAVTGKIDVRGLAA